MKVHHIFFSLLCLFLICPSLCYYWYYQDSDSDSETWYSRYGDTYSFFHSNLYEEGLNTSTFCPSQYTFYHGSCYKLVESEKTWPLANASCMTDISWYNRSSHLVNIKNRAENWFTQHLATDFVWLGLTDARQSGTFQWEPDGSVATYNNWYDPITESGSTNPVDCALMWGGMKWRKTLCSEKYYYICEVSADIPENISSTSSCEGSCGGFTGSCYCDYGCRYYGDCCDDACDFCEEACSPPDKSLAPVCAYIGDGAYISDGGTTGAAYVVSSNGTGWDWQGQEILEPDTDYGYQYFGYSVDGFGDDDLIVGAPLLVSADGSVSYVGGAYIFKYNGTDYTRSLIRASDGASNDRFGYSVAAISSDSVVIGAPFDDECSTYGGAAYIFSFNGTSWIEEDQLCISDGGSYFYFGWTVDALSESKVLVGTIYDGGYVFEKSSAGWLQEAFLWPESSLSLTYFGTFLCSIGSKRAAVSDYGSSEYAWYGGCVVIFAQSGSSSWEEEAILYDMDLEDFVYFGGSVAGVSDQVVAVGAYRKTLTTSYQGAIFVFERRFSSGGDYGGGWVFDTVLVDSNPNTYAFLGYTLAGIDGNTILSGGYDRKVVMFQKVASNWTQTEEFYGDRLNSWGADSYGLHGLALNHCNRTAMTSCIETGDHLSVQLDVFHSNSESLCWLLVQNDTNYSSDKIGAWLVSACNADTELLLCSHMSSYYCFSELTSSEQGSVSSTCNVTGGMGYSLYYYSTNGDGSVSVLLESAIWKVEPFNVTGTTGYASFWVESFWDHPCNQEDGNLVHFQLPMNPQSSGTTNTITLTPNLNNQSVSRQLSCSWLLEPEVYGGRLDNSTSELYDSIHIQITWKDKYKTDLLAVYDGLTENATEDCIYYGRHQHFSSSLSCTFSTDVFKSSGGYALIVMDIDTTDETETELSMVETDISLEIQFYGTYCTSASCNDHGTCEFGICNCDSAYSGDACEINMPQDWTCNADKYNTNRTCDCSCGAYDPDCNLGVDYQTCNISEATKYQDYYQRGMTTDLYCTYCYLPETLYEHVDYPDTTSAICPDDFTCSYNDGKICDSQTGICVDSELTSDNSEEVYLKMCLDDSDCPSALMSCVDSWCSTQESDSYTTTGQAFPITKDGLSCSMPYSYTSPEVDEDSCDCDGYFGFDYDEALSVAMDYLEDSSGNSFTEIIDECSYSSPHLMIVTAAAWGTTECKIVTFSFASSNYDSSDNFEVRYNNSQPVYDALSGLPVTGQGSDFFCLAPGSYILSATGTHSSTKVEWPGHSQYVEANSNSEFSICTELEVTLEFTGLGPQKMSAARYEVRGADGNVTMDKRGNPMTSSLPLACSSQIDSYCVPFGTQMNLVAMAGDPEMRWKFNIFYQTFEERVKKFRGVLGPAINASRGNFNSPDLEALDECAVIGQPYNDGMEVNAGFIYLVGHEIDGSWYSLEEAFSDSGTDGDDQLGTSIDSIGETHALFITGGTKLGTNNDGGARIYSFRDDELTLEAELKANETSSQYQNECGGSVTSIGSDRVAMGCENYLHGVGGASIWRFNGIVWREEAMVSPADGLTSHACYGVDAIGDSKLLLGCEGYDKRLGRGVVFAYVNGTWIEEAGLVPDGVDHYSYCGRGESIAGLSSTKAAVGCYIRSEVFIFHFSGSSWYQTHTLSKSPVSDYFGGVLHSLSENTLAISSQYGEGVGSDETNTGRVEIYEYTNASGSDMWIESQILYAKDFHDYNSDLKNMHFGYAIHSMNNRLIISSESAAGYSKPGDVFIYAYQEQNASWKPETFYQTNQSYSTYSDLTPKAVALVNCSMAYDLDCISSYEGTPNTNFSFMGESTSCSAIHLTVSLDWSYNEAISPSLAFFEIINTRTGSYVDNWGVEMEGVASHGTKVFYFCVSHGPYEVILYDYSGGGWHGGTISISYSYQNRLTKVMDSTIEHDESGKTITFELYPTEGYYLHITTEWPVSVPNTYPNEGSFSLYYIDSSYTDEDGRLMTGTGVEGNSTSTFRVSGALPMVLTLADSFGDGWDEGLFKLEFSYSKNGTRYTLESGTLTTGSWHAVPFFIDPSSGFATLDFYFEDTNGSWALTKVSKHLERHGCACGLCDSFGFDLSLAENLAQSYLNLTATDQNHPYSFCHSIGPSQIIVSYNFVQYQAVELTYSKSEYGEWYVSDSSTDSMIGDYRCYVTSTYEDCIEDHTRDWCYIDANYSQQYTCSDYQFSTCGNRYDTAYSTLSGVFSGGLVYNDLACTLRVSPNIPTALLPYATVNFELGLQLEAQEKYTLRIVVYDGEEASSEIVKNLTTAAESFSNSDMSMEMQPTTLSQRVNYLISSNETLKLAWGHLAGFTGTWSTDFNVSFSDMDLEPTCSDADFCFTKNFNVIVIDDNLKNLTSGNISFLVDVSSANSIWLNFAEFELMHGDKLLLSDGVGEAPFAEVGDGWFDVDSGQSLSFNSTDEDYAVIEIEEYPLTIMGWFEVESYDGDIIFLADEDLVLGITDQRRPYAKYKSFQWYALEQVEVSSWFHLTFLRHDDAGFYEFLVNGESFSTCSGVYASRTPCPDVTNTTDFPSETPRGYLMVGNRLGPLEDRKSNNNYLFKLDNLLFFNERLDQAEVFGAATNGSLSCDYSDTRLQRCFHFDEDVSDLSGQVIADDSLYKEDAMVFGPESSDGITGLSNMSITTFASNGGNLLITLVPGNSSKVFASQVLLAYEAISCSCENGVCVQGVCICNPGWGGEDCLKDLVSDACSNTNTYIQGGELSGTEGNMTVLAPYFSHKADSIYPSICYKAGLPTDLNCDWILSKDYTIMSISAKQLFNYNAKDAELRVYDGLTRDNTSELIWDKNFFNDTSSMGVSGSSGELQVEFDTNNHSRFGGGCGIHGLRFSYLAQNIWYVAPSSDFYFDPEATEGSASAPFFSIQDAHDQAEDGDILLLYPGTYQTSDIYISKPITIKSISGPEYTSLDGSGDSRILSIETVGTVYLNGLNFIDGYAYDGGAIKVTMGHVSFYDCHFVGNSAEIGGAIYIREPAIMEAYSIHFDDGVAGYGGAIYADSASLELDTVEFVNNYAENGGAVYLDSSHSSFPVLDLENGYFYLNEASNIGIIYLASKSSIILDRVTFLKNTVQYCGVWIAASSTAVISSFTATGNSATEDIGSVLCVSESSTVAVTLFRIVENDGTAVYAIQSTIEFDQGVFSRNSGDYFSAGQFFEASISIANTEISHHGVSALWAEETILQVLNTTLTNNSAAATGGAVLSMYLLSIALFDSVVASENTAPLGGVIYVVDCSGTGYGLVISNSLFSNNSADLDDAGMGGCIYAESSNVNVTNTSFIENYAVTSGGVMYLSSVNDPSIFVGSFNNYTQNQAYRGGCFYLDDYSVATSQMDLFMENQASDYGGGWLVSGSEVTLSNQRYYGCKAGSYGGGFLIMLYSVVIIEEMEFIECTAGTGGAMAARSESTITGTDINVVRCSADYGGGMAFQEESIVLMNRILFKNNSATVDGGALYLVRIDISTSILNDAVFTNSQADETGGAIYAALCDSVIFNNITSSGSKAASGSDICALASVVTLNDSLIEASTSDTGSLYLLHATVDLNRITLQDQDALVDGGAIYGFSSELRIVESTFRNGSAEQGGSIFLFETDITVIDSEFSYNQATVQGGAWYISGTDAIYISGCSFYDNYAGTVGGAIYIEDATNFFMLGSVIDHNKAAEEGAGIALLETEAVVITGCSIFNNIVTQTAASTLYDGVGLKLYMIDYALISGSSFLGNYGAINGGAIYISYSVADIVNCIFSANYGYYGGAIYCGPEPSTSSVISVAEEYRRLENLAPTLLKSRPVLPYTFKRKAGWRKKRVLRKSLNHPALEGRLLAQQSYISLDECIFEENTALSGGGALYYEEIEPEGMSTSNFTDNTALYGSSYTAPASYIEAHHFSQLEASGKTVSTILIYLMDSYHQLVRSENGTTIFASVSDEDADETTISGTTSVDFIEGIGTFDNLIVEKTPNSSTTIIFATSLVTGETNVTLNFRPCYSGEVLPEDSGTCKVCSYGTFSWVPGETSCHDCPTGAVCYGGDQVKATLGYWRFDNTTGTCDDDDIYDDCTLIECEETSACIGDIFLTDGAYLSSDYTKIYTGSDGDSVYEELIDLCQDDDGYFPDCTLFFGDGFNVSVIPISDKAVTDSYINIEPKSTALLKSSGVTASESETYDLYLSQEESCGTGYAGNVCANCDTNYYSAGTTACTECPESLALSYFILACGIIGVGIFGAIMIRLQMNKENSSNEKLSIMMKIFTSYMQLVSLFGNVDLDWPQIIITLFEKEETISRAGESIISIECVLNSNYHASEDSSPVYFQKFAFFMALPILAVIVSVSFWNLVYQYKRLKLARKPWDYAKAGLDGVIADGLIEHHEVKETLEKLGENNEPLRVDAIIKHLNMRKHPARVEDFQEAWLMAFKRVLDDNVVLSVIILLFMLHPNIAEYTFTVFTCDELRTGHYYLTEDYETECYTSAWWNWAYLGAVCIAIYTLGIPVFGAYVLHSVRYDLADKHVKLKYGFLYDGYEADFYWWEMWVMMRKVMVTFITVFVEPVGPLTEVATALAVTFFSTCLHLRYQPYEEDDLDRLESYSLYATSITLFMGIYFYCDEFNNIGSEVFFICVIIFANVAFVLYFFKAGYSEFRNKILTDIETAKETVTTIKRGKELHKQRTEYTGTHKHFMKEMKRGLAEYEEKNEERCEMIDAITHIKADIQDLKKTMILRNRQYEDSLRDLSSIDEELKNSKVFLEEMVREHHPDFLKLLQNEFMDEAYDKLIETAVGDVPEPSVKEDSTEGSKLPSPQAQLHPILSLYNDVKMKAEMPHCLQLQNQDFEEFTKRLSGKAKASGLTMTSTIRRREFIPSSETKEISDPACANLPTPNPIQTESSGKSQSRQANEEKLPEIEARERVWSLASDGSMISQQTEERSLLKDGKTSKKR